LIVGLPGESVESFAAGFDRLVALRPQEIQVGILKRLRGTPIVRHDAEWQMVYGAQPPYEILQTRLIDFATMQRLRRFARFWDLFANSGNFIESIPLLWTQSGKPFASFLEFSDWIHARLKRTHSLPLADLMEALFVFLTEQRGRAKHAIALALLRDYQRAGRTDTPEFLRQHIGAETGPAISSQPRSGPKRQSRHLTANNATPEFKALPAEPPPAA
ncbi:MAG: DUF4080 domain-containing protein, partial [Verrucomicrobia bacterium]|nr:DUF4080 domain-containing protein [Verrucomicrobiota bacterium]